MSKADRSKLMHADELSALIGNDVSTVVFLVGPPASGKSTISEPLVKAGFKRLSMDVIRGELFGDEGNVSQGALVKATLVERYEEALKQKECILLDNTNCQKRPREALILKAREAGYESIVLVVMLTPLRTCLKRNKKRSRVVPDDAIRLFHSQMVGKEKPVESGGAYHRGSSGS